MLCQVISFFMVGLGYSNVVVRLCWVEGYVGSAAGKRMSRESLPSYHTHRWSQSTGTLRHTRAALSCLKITHCSPCGHSSSLPQSPGHIKQLGLICTLSIFPPFFCSGEAVGLFIASRRGLRSAEWNTSTGENFLRWSCERPDIQQEAGSPQGCTKTSERGNLRRRVKTLCLLF